MKIRNQKGRKDGNSAYNRVFNNSNLGDLISKIQATVISNGNELERIILSQTNTIDNLNEFIDKAETGEISNGVFVCSKRNIKSSNFAVKNPIDNKGIEPDLLVFIVEQHRICKIIELKDGDTFDTKKAAGEKEHLVTFSKEFGRKIPFRTEIYICSFNQNDINTIKTGLKNTFTEQEILTGKSFCDILNLDYDKIIQTRLEDAEDNLTYFVEELLKIEQVRKKIINILDKQ